MKDDAFEQRRTTLGRLHDLHVMRAQRALEAAALVTAQAQAEVDAKQQAVAEVQQRRQDAMDEMQHTAATGGCTGAQLQTMVGHLAVLKRKEEEAQQHLRVAQAVRQRAQAKQDEASAAFRTCTATRDQVMSHLGKQAKVHMLRRERGREDSLGDDFALRHGARHA